MGSRNGNAAMALKVSSPWETHTPPEELIDGVLDRLRIDGQDRRSRIEREIRGIATNFTAALEREGGSQKMSKARALLHDLPSDLRAMAERLDQAQVALDSCGATHRFFEDPGYRLDNRSEILNLKAQAARCSLELNGLAEFIEPRMARGKSKAGDGRTGGAKVYDIVHGTAKRQLAENVVLLFAKWRPNDKVRAGQSGDLLVIIQRIYELATGRKTKSLELLTPLQEAVRAYNNHK